MACGGRLWASSKRIRWKLHWEEWKVLANDWRSVVKWLNPKHKKGWAMQTQIQSFPGTMAEASKQNVFSEQKAKSGNLCGHPVLPLRNTKCLHCSICFCLALKYTKKEVVLFLPGTLAPLIPPCTFYFRGEVPPRRKIQSLQHLLNTYYGWALSYSEDK